MSIKNKFTRREFLTITSIGAAGILLSKNVNASILDDEKSKEMLLYVGTFTEKTSEGIYVFKFNTETGELSKLHTVKNVVQPSFLTIDKSRKFLYAVNETEEFEGKKAARSARLRLTKRRAICSF